MLKRLRNRIDEWMLFKGDLLDHIEEWMFALICIGYLTLFVLLGIYIYITYLD